MVVIKKTFYFIKRARLRFDDHSSSSSYIERAEMFRGAKKALERYLAEVKRVTTPRPFDFREELMLWDFTKEETNNWDCISDNDIKGFSNAQFQPNRKGRELLN